MSVTTIDHPNQSECGDSLCSSESYDDSMLRCEIQSDLKSMSFEEIIKLKEQLGAKLYAEAILSKAPKGKKKITFKRVNKNRPREAPAKKQVPFLGGVAQPKKQKAKAEVRDPRFDKNSGNYDPHKFKENYRFLREIREREIIGLRHKLLTTKDESERKQIKFVMQRLKNKNVEDDRWLIKQDIIKEEQEKIQRAKAQGKKPHYSTKKEQRVKELVKNFVELKNSGNLSKHLEKKRKKNAAKDRKKLNLG